MPTTRRALGKAALLAVPILALAVVASVLPRLSSFQEFLAGAVQSVRTRDMTALEPILYGVAGVAAFVLMLALLRLIDALGSRIKTPNPRDGYPEKSIEEFAREAVDAKISVRVARESYELLSRYYPDRMCIDLDQDLRDDLKLTDDDIIQLHAGLMNRTDRREMRSLSAESIGSVHDLLDSVDRAPQQHADEMEVRLRATELPSAERGAMMDSGLCLLGQASEARRRASDYTGPRRRASDNKVKRAYSGPHRRATDRLQAPVAAKSVEQPAADLNKQSPLLVAPRPKQITN